MWRAGVSPISRVKTRAKLRGLMAALGKQRDRQIVTHMVRHPAEQIRQRLSRTGLSRQGVAEL